MIEPEKLLDIFARRPKRFSLIEQALDILKPVPGGKWLEVGCNTGDATAFLCEKCGLDAVGIDFNTEAIEEGKQKHPYTNLVCARVQNIPFEDNSFCGIISEAAWSPLTDKDMAAKEYARVVMPGGYLVINDFILKPTFTADSVAQYSYMPCFAGVGSMDSYGRHFEKEGFECIQATVEKNYLASISFHLIKECHVKPTDIGPLLAFWGNDGHPNCGITQGAVSGAEEALKQVDPFQSIHETDEERSDALKQGGLSFGQLLMRKR
jgi:Methylase involved in ubiquinone/menaquinone biosynthesis